MIDTNIIELLIKKYKKENGKKFLNQNDIIELSKNKIIEEELNRQLDLNNKKTVNYESIPKKSEIQDILEAFFLENNITILTKYEDFHNMQSPSNLDILKHYLTEIGSIKLYSEEEEKEAFKKLQNASSEEEKKEIKNEIVSHNLKLVVSIAKRYINNGLDLLDLIQYGNMGLMKSIEKFDPDKGYKLSTYATWWIKQSIKRGIEETSRVVRLPVYIYSDIRKYKKYKNDIEEATGKKQSIETIVTKIFEEEIGESINTNGIKYNKKQKEFLLQERIKRVKFVLQNYETIISLDQKIAISDEDNEATIGDFIQSETNDPEEIVIDEMYSKQIENMIDESNLKIIEKYIIKRRFGFPINDELLAKTLSYITYRNENKKIPKGQKKIFSEENTKDIYIQKKEAIKKLRQFIKSNDLYYIDLYYKENNEITKEIIKEYINLNNQEIIILLNNIKDIPEEKIYKIKQLYNIENHEKNLKTGETTLEIIGNELEVTRERIRQIEARVLRKLRISSDFKKLQNNNNNNNNNKEEIKPYTYRKRYTYNK